MMSARHQTRFYYARHGETDWNARDLFIGQKDIPLNQRGLQQAKMLAESCLDRDIAAIYTSPLVRASNTARIVGAKLGISVHQIDGLAEVFLGALEGAQETEMDFFSQWESNQMPNDVEAFETFQHRVIDAVDCILQNSKGALIIAHSAVYYALAKHIGASAKSEIPNAELIELNWSSSQQPIMDQSKE